MLHRLRFAPLLTLLVTVTACASDSNDVDGTGGNAATGGSTSTGGTAGQSSGGASTGGTAGTATGKGGSGTSGAATGGTSASGGAGAVGSGATAGNAAGSGGVAGTVAAGGTAGSSGGTPALGGAGAGGSDGGTTSSGGAGSGGGGASAGAGAGGMSSGGMSSGGTGPTGTFTEDDAEGCDAGTLPMPSANSKLPDPFKKADGTRITTKAEWRCQRHFLRKVMERYAYGEKPIPDMVTGTVANDEVTVNVSHGGKSASFDVEVDLPSSGSAPYPVIIGYLGFGSISLNETFVKNQGVAIIKFDPFAVGQEGTGRPNKAGAFYTIHGSTHGATGLLAAWAWGVSRIIDVLEADGDKLLKSTAVGVTGCSRFGKGSFVAGAFDQRIALGIPFESGTAGVPIFRGIGKLEQSQSLSSAYGEQPWFGDVFQPFVSNINNMPGDTHTTIGMYAPRGLLILDNPHIANLGPKAAHVAAQAGAEIYKALGAEANIGYISNVADGGHCSWRPEFEAPLKAAIDKHLHKKDGAAGAINPRSSATGNLAEWRDWTTPALN